MKPEYSQISKDSYWGYEFDRFFTNDSAQYCNLSLLAQGADVALDEQSSPELGEQWQVDPTISR